MLQLGRDSASDTRHGENDQHFSPSSGLAGLAAPFSGLASMALIRSSRSRSSCDGCQGAPGRDAGRSAGAGSARRAGGWARSRRCRSVPTRTKPGPNVAAGSKDLRRTFSRSRRSLWPCGPQVSSFSFHSVRARQRSCGFFSNFRSLPAKYPPGPHPRLADWRCYYPPRRLPAWPSLKSRSAGKMLGDGSSLRRSNGRASPSTARVIL
jgi:hypothetical protein